LTRCAHGRCNWALRAAGGGITMLRFKTVLAAFCVCGLTVAPQIVAATTITFIDGLTTPAQPGGTAVGHHYATVGVSTPNLRFHLGTYSGNVPFNFDDGWGAVIDSGISGNTSVIQFSSPVDYVEIAALAQSAFDLGGAKPWSWVIRAYDTDGSLVASATEVFGFTFAGVPNAPSTDPYPLARLLLSVEAVGKIVRLEIDADRKFGIDTLSFEPSILPSAVPLPVTLVLFISGLGLLGLLRSITSPPVAAT
jgi:hypothetical protein